MRLNLLWLTSITSIVFVGGIAIALTSPRGPVARPVEAVGKQTAVAKHGPTKVRFLPVSPEDYRWIEQQIELPRKTVPTLSNLVHLLRVHGLAAPLTDANKKIHSTDDILRILTDADVGTRYFGQSPMVQTPHGIRYPEGSRVEIATQPYLELHRDQTLAAFAESGIPLSHPLRLDEKEYCVEEILRDSVANFHLKQPELEWTGVAYALYRAPTKTWTNRYGEVYSFDQLVEEMLDRGVPDASCGGTHLLYTLTIISRVDEAENILSASVRSRVDRHLRSFVRMAVASQQPDGYWSPDWNYAAYEGGAPRYWTKGDTASQRLVMTSHVAEWLLYLPEGIDVDKSVLRRAALWLSRTLRDATVEDKENNYCPYSHAACALRHIMFVDSFLKECDDRG